jgi:hypothetical protein
MQAIVNTGRRPKKYLINTVLLSIISFADEQAIAKNCRLQKG